jgi:hypothetical protein
VRALPSPGHAHLGGARPARDVRRGWTWRSRRRPRRGASAPSRWGDGGGGVAVEFESSEEFEESIPRIAVASAVHRAAAREIVDRLVAKVEELGGAPDRQRRIEEIAVTSDPRTIQGLDEALVEVADELRVADQAGALNRELFADTLGVAAWAIGASAGDEISVAAIEMIPDRRLRFLLRAWSHYYTDVTTA